MNNSSGSFQQAQAEGLCLCYPENLGIHPHISYESAMSMLVKAPQMASSLPFTWQFIDRPQGQ